MTAQVKKSITVNKSKKAVMQDFANCRSQIMVCANHKNYVVRKSQKNCFAQIIICSTMITIVFAKNRFAVARSQLCFAKLRISVAAEIWIISVKKRKLIYQHQRVLHPSSLGESFLHHLNHHSQLMLIFFCFVVDLVVMVEQSLNMKMGLWPRTPSKWEEKTLCPKGERTRSS